MGKCKGAGEVGRTTYLERRAAEGKGLQETKGASAEKLESWMRRPVQPESAMSGEDGRSADTAPN